MSLFDSRLLVEGVRVVDAESPALSTYSTASKETSFESLLFEHAKNHAQSSEINMYFLHFKKISNNVYTLFALLLFVFGGLAVNKMLFTEQLITINFFWAFALFFIPNICMFFVWLILFLKPNLLQNSSLARFNLAFIKQFEHWFNKPSFNNKDYLALFNCYFHVLFTKQLGRYQLSKLTHLLWLSYFAGATLMSIVMLSTHQVDFVWQTSILSSDSFQTLTQLLAYLPQRLGFPVPSIEQIQQSYLGAHDLLDAENRRLVWSSLLISSLLLYGLLPRLFLYLLMALQFKQQKSRYHLDLSAPYYVQLRQLLKPNKTSIGITDADENAQGRPANSKETHLPNESKEGVLPALFYPIAIELSGRQLSLAEAHLQQYKTLDNDKLLNVCDHQAQQRLLVELAQNENRTIVLYVALNRLPDRGLKRFIGQLSSLPERSVHLAMIIEDKHNKQRDSDWYQLANEVGIKLDNILHIETKGSKHE